jgi:hypothetical protein
MPVHLPQFLRGTSGPDGLVHAPHRLAWPISGEPAQQGGQPGRLTPALLMSTQTT